MSGIFYFYSLYDCEMEKIMNDYIKQQLIGEGTFGTVWLVKSIVSGKQHVLKDINMRRMTEIERQRALTEVTILSKCRHNNIIAYKNSYLDRPTKSLYILMDYADGGDLLTAIEKQNGVPFPESDVMSWFTQICLAVQYIHYNNIVHRDLKCKNIFLTKNKVIKVGDFGIARILKNSEDLATTKIGTPFYLSPEICKLQPYNSKSDIWALGCILFEMSALDYLFEASDFRELIIAILNMNRRSFPKWSGPVIRDLVSHLLQPDPILRPSADEILAYPSLQPYLVRYSTCTKIPHLSGIKKCSSAETFEKKDGLKRGSEKNYSLETNKVRFTSTGKLHVRSNFQMVQQLDFKKEKNPSGKAKKIQNQPDLTKKNKSQTVLDRTYNIQRVTNPISRELPNHKEFSLKIQKDIDCSSPQKKDANCPFVKPRRNRPVKELSTDKCEQKYMKKKTEINVYNETNLSTSSSSICVTKSPCHHSQCHRCMIDMLWKNRIQNCQKTSINNEEYCELQNKLLSVFKKETFHKVYHSLFKDWYDIEDLEMSSKSYTKSLTYEQMQHLPLMIQLVQLDMLSSVVQRKK